MPSQWPVDSPPHLYGAILIAPAVFTALLLSQARPLFLSLWKRFRCRIEGWAFLLNGREIMQDKYKQSNGTPFAIDAPENRYWVVSSPEQIKEMDAAPQAVLSLLGAAKDFLQPKYTMKEFDWMEEKQGTEGATLVKTLRNDLTGRLPMLLPEIRRSMTALVNSHFESVPPLKGPPARAGTFLMADPRTGAKSTSIFPIVRRAIAQSNAFIFFGRELSNNAEFIKAGISMVEHTVIISDVVRLLPHAVADPAGKFLAGRLGSSSIVYDALESLVAQRFEERDRARMGHEVPEYWDCVQWIMDNSPKTKPWTVQRVVHELMALWFGSVHITSVTACFALLDLCRHEEYVAPLQKEVENTGWEAFQKSGGKLFPLMDSFIKESSRLNPVECLSTRRKALKPFHFQDGTTIQKGQWVCTPLAGMSRDPKNHACPDEFHGFRFVEPEILNRYSAEVSTRDFQIPEGAGPAQFTDMSGLPFWGVGKMTCGGRFYASAAIKTLLGVFLTKWDLQLKDPDAKQHFAWRSWICPYESTKVVARPRV
ncbi:hypothetical protein PG993_007934 [Apiospora rasikravindrae]|uniref:Cytochrome P450 n=1 Tax=Apiospora rasikravindrae TaxID=990691 RepID=A0ABR1SYW4_9PEZI